jgi:predicted membrane-bound mannosyltransferase
MAIGLMHATKETAILAWAAMGAAGVYTLFFYGKRRAFPLRDIFWALLACALVSMLFFSSFLTHPRGVLDSVLTYTSYVHRAGGAGMHDQPWYTYLAMLLYTKRPFGPRWSEGLIVGLALVGMVAAFVSPGRSDKRLLRFLAVYTVVLTIVYAIIPYKTPWSMLSFFHGMILLAGVGAVALVRWARFLPLRMVVAALLALATTQLANQAWKASYLYPSDYRNPYVYAHPVPDVLRLAERFEDLAKFAPEGHSLVVKVMLPGGDYWPLPWYLRKFEHVGYWQDVPADPDADIIVTSRPVQPQLDSALKNKYQVEFYGLRPDIILVVYIRQDLWDAFLQTRG